MYSSFDPRRFASRVGTWLQEKGPDGDVVVSCRARLARNVEGYKFVSRLEQEQAEELCEKLRPLLLEKRLGGETSWIEIPTASTIVRLLLRERHIVSRDLAPSDPKRPVKPGSAVAFAADESISVMVNEEDHLRLQSMSAGFSLGDAWRRVRELDRDLEQEVGFSFSSRLGYLTGCPTNVGTGLRASVMVHLPALGLVRSELEKVFSAAQRTGLAVRGMYGEGSRAAGDFYQISNQVTLGRTEEQLIHDLEALVPCIVDFERRVRGALLEERRPQLQDRVTRSYGMLRTARSMPTEVALAHLSNVRLGGCLGLLEGEDPVALNGVAIQIQKAHVQALCGEQPADELIEPNQRDRLRASFLRQRFAKRGA
ncbi:MAG: ATP--guanido phosphotransferase [Planctomycetota bacterium]|nr:ATP--guanido phosphotransferase [Planctomycetota bacterium]